MRGERKPGSPVTFTRSKEGDVPFCWTCDVCGSLNWSEEAARDHAEQHKSDDYGRHTAPKRLSF